MYGWRGRLGIMVPSSNTTMENEFHEVKPEGVSVHVSRLMLKQAVTDELLEMEAHMEKAAGELATANVDVIVYGCTTGSLIKGKGHDEQIEDTILQHTGVKAVTTSGAVLAIMELLQCKELAILTPYLKELDDKEAQFLEANGFKVKDIYGMGLANNLDIGKVSPHQVFNLCQKINTRNVDALFISCTNLRTFEIINVLERDIGKPVITSNQASFWMALKELGISLCEVTKIGSVFQNI